MRRTRRDSARRILWSGTPSSAGSRGRKASHESSSGCSGSSFDFGAEEDCRRGGGGGGAEERSRLGPLGAEHGHKMVKFRPTGLVDEREMEQAQLFATD